MKKAKGLIAFISAVMLLCGTSAIGAYAAGGNADEGTVISGEGAEHGEQGEQEEPELIDIAGADISCTAKLVYDGTAKAPEVTVKYKGEVLVKDTDFTVKYTGNTAVGTAKATVTGIGRFTGTAVKTFEITAPTVSAPAKLRCTDANIHIIVMRWNTVTGADGYQLQYYDPSNKIWTGTKNISGKSGYYKYDNSAFAVGTTYSLRLRAFKTVGGRKFYSDWSTAYGTTDPAAVTGIKESSANEKGYTLSWNKAQGALKYEVLRWSPVTGKYEIIATVSTNKYVVTDRTPGQKNTYKVRGIRTVTGNSTVFHGALTSFKAAAACSKVTGIKATARQGKVTVSWLPVEKANGYEVYYTDANGNNPVTLATVNANTRTYSTTKLKAGQKYKLKVKAISKYGTAVAKSKYPSGVLLRVFENISYNTVLDNYYSQAAITVDNGHGYVIPQYLKNNLNYHLTKLGGVVSFAMLDLDSGTLIASNGKYYMGTASTVKMPFMLYCLNEMESGWPTLDTTMTYTAQDYHSGSGIIQTYNYGTVLTIRDIINTIFDYSDNIGYYMLQRQFGINGYNKFISSLGCRVSMNYSNRWGYICATDSCKEWLKMYEYFDKGKYGTFMRNGFAHSCASNFRRGIGNKYTVYSKCGWTEDLHHDTAVVEAEHPYVLISFTNRVSAGRLMEIAQAADAIHTDMWNYFLK